jgi:K+-sensing histidine kinase KdpD
VKAELLQGVLRGIELPILVCQRTWQPSSRLLVLHQANDSSQEFLNNVASLCDRLRVTPVILTVARNGREARVQEQVARTIWATRGLDADFDSLIGCDVRTAVVSVARWRRCTHIFVDHQRTSPWWRWLRGDTLGHFLGLTDSFSILALPTFQRPVVHPEPASTTQHTR